MKFLLFLVAVTVTGCLLSPVLYANPLANHLTDTAVITHRVDGVTNEWPDTTFETDLGTDIKYAVDNDSANLYMALDIANEGIQMKIMKMGMNMYIDLKAKKKESRGISFPVKEEKRETETPPVNKEEDTEKRTAQQKLQDKKVMRSMMALHLVYMKIFGFEGLPSQDQGLTMPGSINIAFSWDTLSVLHIEYRVPLKMLGGGAVLDKKEISIGWKLNGMYPSDNPRYYSEQTRGNGRQRIGADNKPIIERETIIREQNIWQKYFIKTGR